MSTAVESDAVTTAEPAGFLAVNKPETNKVTDDATLYNNGDKGVATKAACEGAMKDDNNKAGAIDGAKVSNNVSPQVLSDHDHKLVTMPHFTTLPSIYTSAHMYFQDHSKPAFNPLEAHELQACQQSKFCLTQCSTVTDPVPLGLFANYL